MQVNFRLSQNLTILPEEIIYKILGHMCSDSIGELHRLLIRSKEKKELSLHAHLIYFLGHYLKHIRFDGYMLRRVKDWRTLDNFCNLMAYVPEQNIITSVTIINPHVDTLFIFPTHVKITKLKFTISFIERLMIDTTHITHLTLACVMGSPRIIRNRILYCENLQYLHFDDFNNTNFAFSQLQTLRLTTLKLTGQMARPNICDLCIFIRSQAPTLRKFTMKLRNQANLIHKLHLNTIEFTQLKKLKILIAPDYYSQEIPINLLQHIQSIKLMIGWNGRVNIETYMDQLIGRQNITLIKFFGRIERYDRLILEEYIQKFQDAQHRCNIAQTKPNLRLFINTIF